MWNKGRVPEHGVITDVRHYNLFAKTDDYAGVVNVVGRAGDEIRVDLQDMQP
mgnify:CR=1 FL=1